MRLMICSLGAAALLLACASTPESAPESANAPSLHSGIDVENLDPETRPQDDFYQYINGGWLASNTIPADRSRWGTFDTLREAAEAQVLVLIEDAAAEAESGAAEVGSDSQKIGDLYRSYMDTERVEALGAAPLAPLLAEIDAVNSTDALIALWGDASRQQTSAPIAPFIGQDPGDSSRYIVQLTQSGLGLPDRDYYLGDDARSREIVRAYRDHIERMFELAGLDNGTGAAARIIALEGRLAEAHWSRVRNRDRTATYNPHDPDALARLAPAIDWQRYLAAADLDPADVDVINVRQPDYLAALGEVIDDVPLSHWQDYHRFHLIRRSAPWLSEAFEEERFDFYGRTLSGQPEMRPRERRGMGLVESALGFMVGRLYVDAHFPPDAAARMDEMVTNLLAAFAQSIDDLDWMSDETRVEAHAKLARFNTKIGAPTQDRDYDCVEVRADDLFGNVLRSDACEHARQVERLGGPVDREEWFITPQTVNAYYSPAMNEIVFPAAILQPPFFDVNADPAVNYGAIGAVIGHEITHGFDDQGRRMDGDGNLRDWWTEQDAERFSAQADAMVAQYDAFRPLEDMNINGALALGENIADLGGLSVAYRAWRRSLDGEASPVLDGFTGEQRLFAGWGQIWRTLYREEALRRHLITGPHAPGRYRVLGIVSNLPEFHQAFDVEPGDPMYRSPEERIRIW